MEPIGVIGACDSRGWRAVGRGGEGGKLCTPCCGPRGLHTAPSPAGSPLHQVPTLLAGWLAGKLAGWLAGKLLNMVAIEKTFEAAKVAKLYVSTTTLV